MYFPRLESLCDSCVRSRAKEKKSIDISTRGRNFMLTCRLAVPTYLRLREMKSPVK